MFWFGFFVGGFLRILGGGSLCVCVLGLGFFGFFFVLVKPWSVVKTSLPPLG